MKNLLMLIIAFSFVGAGCTTTEKNESLKETSFTMKLKCKEIYEEFRQKEQSQGRHGIWVGQAYNQELNTCLAEIWMTGDEFGGWEEKEIVDIIKEKTVLHYNSLEETGITSNEYDQQSSKLMSE